jgi:hypothetical protein
MINEYNATIMSRMHRTGEKHSLITAGKEISIFNIESKSWDEMDKKSREHQNKLEKITIKY